MLTANFKNALEERNCSIEQPIRSNSSSFHESKHIGGSVNPNF